MISLAVTDFAPLVKVGSRVIKMFQRDISVAMRKFNPWKTCLFVFFILLLSSWHHRLLSSRNCDLQNNLGSDIVAEAYMLKELCIMRNGHRV